MDVSVYVCYLYVRVYVCVLLDAMFVCVCVSCIHICVYVRVCACMQVFLPAGVTPYASMCVCTGISMHVCARARIGVWYLSKSTSMCIFMYVVVCV